MSQIPPALPADERRRAFATTRGFVFQWWLSVLAWLELKDDEVLYVESSEDFEVVSLAEGTTVQAKAGARDSLTLRSPEVLDALNHYWQIAAQDRRKIRFVLLAQAEAGIEQGVPFGPGVSGIGLWMSGDGACAPEIVEKLRYFLRDDGQVALKLTSTLRQFIRDASTDEVRSQLIERVTFDTGREPTGTVQQLVRDRLVVLAAERHGATVAEAERVADVLFSNVVHLAANKERVPLSRAHVLRVLEENIVQHRQRIGLALPSSTAVGPEVSGGALWESPGNELTLPPLPERILPRPELVARICAQLRDTGALVLVGSTGMGKTTLAKLTARAAAGAWWWLDLQGCPLLSAQIAFRKILVVADQHRGAPINIILDGFVPDGLPTAAVNTLRAIAWLVRRRGGKIVLTSQKLLTVTEAASFGWTNAMVVAAPRMDSAEIARFLCDLGCADAPLAELWAMAIHVHTQGHPQLVHAACLWLLQQHWPKFDGQAFQASASNVETERAQARRLVAQLSGDELELLTRLSVLGDTFRRDQALGLAEKLERLAGAGYRFDALVGPWIEPADAAGYHRLSPLLEDSAAAAVGTERRADLETACALTRLESRPVYFPDAARALRHALAGKSPALVAQIAAKFLLTPHNQRAKAFGPLLWLTWFPDAAVDRLFATDVNAGVFVHLLRFQIALTLTPTQVAPYIEACEKSIARLPADRIAGQRFVLVTEALMQCAKHLKAVQVVRYLEEVPALSHSLGDGVDAATWFARVLLPPALRTVPAEDRVRISLAGLVLGDVAGRTFMDDLMVALKELPAERRAKLVEAFGAWPTLLTLVVDKIWLEEADKSPPEWEPLLAWFAAMASMAAEWKADAFVVPFVRAASVVCNEYLNDPNRAARFLGKIEATTPGYSALILDQRAKIAAQKNELPEALAAVRGALPLWEESDFGIHPKMLVLQRAGTWAGKLELWPESAEHFSQGAKLAKKLRSVVAQAGFETDAAVAWWRADRKAAALDSFARAIELCTLMSPATGDLATFQFQKLLGHILMTLALTYRRSASSPAQAPILPGMASEPTLNEKVKTLPPPRLAACKVFVAMLEHNHCLGETYWGTYKTEVLSSRSLSTRNFALELMIRKTVNRADLAGLAALAGQQASVLAVTRTSAANPNTIEQFYKDDDVDFPSVTGDFGDQLFGESLFVAGLISAAIQGISLADALRALDTHVAESPFPDALEKWLKRAQAIATASEAESYSISRSGAEESDRVVASVALLAAPRLAPDTLWGVLYVVLMTLNSMYWGADVLRLLDRLAGERWRAAAENRFAFRNPTLWLPDLKEICASPPTGTKRLAAMLLAVLPALDLKLDRNIVTQLQQMRDGISTTSWQQIAPGFR